MIGIKGRTIALFLAGFLAGVFALSEQAVPLRFQEVSLLVAFCFLVIALLRFKFSKKVPAILIFCSALAFGFFFGIFRFDQVRNGFDHADINAYGNQKVIFSGFVENESTGSKGQEQVTFRVLKVTDNGDTKTLGQKTRVSLTFQAGTSFYYGDILEVEGKLAAIKNKEDSFDYASYEKTKGILYEMYYPHLVSSGGFGGNRVIGFLYNAKNYFESNIDSFFKEPYASLASGMAIAGKGSLSSDLQNIFLRAGLIHIVVLSGYNIALVVSFVSLFLKGLHLRWRIFLTALFVILFMLMVGTSASVVRAALMAFVTLSGNMFHRPVRQNRALLLVSSIMVWINPYILVYDPSFALTFLATFAMINVSPIIAEKCAKISEKFSLREILSQTIAAELLVTPYIMYQMGNFSVIAPLSNVLVLPAVPIVTILSVVVGALGFLRLFLYPIVIVLQFGLTWIVFVAEKISAIPWAFVTVENFSFWSCIGIYGCVFLLVYLLKRRSLKTEKIDI